MGKKEESNTNQIEITKKQKRFYDKQWVKRSALVLVADIVIVYTAFFLALLFRFDLSFDNIPKYYLSRYLWIMPLWCLLTCVVFYTR